MSAARDIVEALDAGDAEVPTVDVATLTVPQLRALPLLNNWNPDAAGQDPKPMLIAAARNRYGSRIPKSLVSESK